jgi:hypothetical protein
MTIFVKSLQKLISEHLMTRLAALHGQVNGLFSSFAYDHDLSNQQAEVISKLNVSVVSFQPTGNDENDKKAISQLIDTAIGEVEAVREQHERTDDGETGKCLRGLNAKVEEFFTKLTKIATPDPENAANITFNLLNLVYQNTPEYILYTHAGYYLGHSVFYPDKHSNYVAKNAKEAALVQSLDLLKKAIHVEDTLPGQQKTVRQILNALENENNNIVKAHMKGSSVPLLSVGLTFLAAPVKCKTVSSGELGNQIKLARREVNAMTLDDFKPLKHVAAAKPAEHVVEEDHEEEETASATL